MYTRCCNHMSCGSADGLTQCLQCCAVAITGTTRAVCFQKAHSSSQPGARVPAMGQGAFRVLFQVQRLCCQPSKQLLKQLTVHGHAWHVVAHGDTLTHYRQVSLLQSKAMMVHDCSDDGHSLASSSCEACNISCCRQQAAPYDA